MKKILSLILSLTATGAAAQSYNAASVGLNKSASPYGFAVNLGTSWAQLGTVSSSGVWSIPVGNIYNGSTPLLSSANTWSGVQTFTPAPVSAALPGLSNRITVDGTPLGPGLDLRTCASTPEICYWYIYNRPTFSGNRVSLRVDKSATATNAVGMDKGGFTDPSIWSLTSTSSQTSGSAWPILSTVYNAALTRVQLAGLATGGTWPQVVAVDGTIFKRPDISAFSPTLTASGTGTTATVTFSPNAVFTGSISGNTLTVTSVASGTIVANTRLSGGSISNPSLVGSQLTGTAGGVGTYVVVTPFNTPQTISSITISSYRDFSLNTNITISGVTPLAYNGTWKITATSAGSVSFLSTATGAQTVAGRIYGVNVSPTWGSNFVCDDLTGVDDPVSSCLGQELDSYVNVPLSSTTAASGTGTTATITYSGPAINPNVFKVGDSVYISGMTPAGYNGTYTVTAVPAANQISFANATTGAQTVAGTIGRVTSDNNNQRVGLQIALGANVPGTEFGYGILMGAGSGSTLKKAIAIFNSSNQETFNVQGNGAVTITSNLGNWSSFNYGKQLIIGPTTSSVTNPAIGILDLNSSNGWALSNGSGTLQFSAMPAVSDSVSAPTVVMSLNRSTKVTSFSGPIVLPSYTVASLPTCNAGSKGQMAYVTNATAPTYNGALTGGGTVAVPVFCNGSSWTSH